MGRAKIVGGGEGGLYSIEMDCGTQQRDARLSAIAARLAEIAPKLAEAESALEQAQAKEAQAGEAAQDAINAYVAAVREHGPGSPEAGEALGAHTVAARKLMEAKQATGVARLRVDQWRTERAEAQRQQAYWQALTLKETRSAWCADLTEDAAGDVATLEIPGEDALVLIKPGAPGPSPSDGRLTAREVQAPEQVFFNAAILPGWQKFYPTFRRGTITALDEEADTASVALDAESSSAQGLPINQADTLDGVPVQYMSCNAGAFEVGDRCVVAFDGQDWSSPRVIGFESNPRPCGFVARYCDRAGYKFTVTRAATFDAIYSEDSIVEWRPRGGSWQRLRFSRAGSDWLRFDSGGADPYVFIEREAFPGLSLVVNVQPKGVDEGEYSGVTEYRISPPGKGAAYFRAAVTYDAEMDGQIAGRVSTAIDWVGVGTPILKL